MTGGPALDFTEPNEVASLEIAIPMLELPQRSLGVRCVEDVAYCFLQSVRVDRCPEQMSVQPL